jgi:hypothetical protein
MLCGGLSCTDEPADSFDAGPRRGWLTVSGLRSDGEAYYSELFGHVGSQASQAEDGGPARKMEIWVRTRTIKIGSASTGQYIEFNVRLIFRDDAPPKLEPPLKLSVVAGDPLPSGLDHAQIVLVDASGNSWQVLPQEKAAGQLTLSISEVVPGALSGTVYTDTVHGTLEGTLVGVTRWGEPSTVYVKGTF